MRDPELREASLQAKLGVVDLFYPDRRIESFAKSNGIMTLALAPDMQALAATTRSYLHGFEKTQLGFGHWNERGHRVAAELIARKLCSGAA